MEVISRSPTERRTSRGFNALTKPQPETFLRDSLVGAEVEPGFWDAASAAFQRENWMVELMARQGLKMDMQGQTNDSPGVVDNPYRYLIDSYDSELLDGDLAGPINDGYFDGLRTPEEIDFKVSTILREKAMLEQMEGSFGGALLGGVGAAALSPESWVPVTGWWAAGAKAARIGKMALHTALSSGVSELALQSQQDLRTLQETFLNVGASGVLGGGFGALGVALSRSHPLNPSHPENPLKPENLRRQGARTRVLGQGDDSIPHASTVGAMESSSSFNVGPSPTRIGGGGTAAGRAINAFTPTGRAYYYRSDVYRRFFTQAVDKGGIYTNTERLGLATKETAEEKVLSWNELGDRVYNSLEFEHRQINQQLAKLGSKKLDFKDFEQVIMKKGLRLLSDQDYAELKARLGDQGAAAVDNKAAEMVSLINRTNQEFERKLIDLGYLRNETRLAKLQKDLQELRQRRDAEIATNRQAVQETREQLQASPDDEALRSRLADLQTQQGEIRQRYNADDLRQQIDQELSLPEPMGDNYFMAQMWDRDGILADQEGFENFLFDVLLEDPSSNPEWLMETQGLTPGQFRALQNDDPARYQDVIRAWAGDEWYHEVGKFERALQGAESRLKEAELDLNDTLRNLGLTSRREGQLKLSEARKKRDRLMTLRQATEQRRVQLKAEQRAIIEAGTAAREQGLQAQLQPIIGEADQARLVRQQERARQVARNLQREDTRLRRVDTKLQAFDEAWDAANDRLIEVRTARENLEQASSQAKAARNVSAKNVRELRRKLRAAQKRPPVEDLVQDIKTALVSGREIPSAIMDKIAPETGRLKGRRLVLNETQRRSAMDAGWLRSDMTGVLGTQYRQLAGQIGFREGLEIGRGQRFSSWEARLQEIEDDYNRLIQEADPKEQVRIQTEKAEVLKDANIIKDRILGLEDNGLDRMGWLNWMGTKFRQVNFLRMGAGFTLSSMTDVGTVALRHKILPGMMDNFQQVRSMVRKDAAESELENMIKASEIAISRLSLARRFGEEDYHQHVGIGTRGSTTRRITAALDNTTERLSTGVSLMSAMPLWNRFWKTFAGVNMSYKLRDMVGRYDALSPLEKTDLASLGIGKAEASRLQRYIDRYSITDENGWWDPNLEEWADGPDGLAATRDFKLAIRRDMNRAINTPGIGDKPRLISKWYGQMLLQFQSFGFAMLNRTLNPAIQRMVHYKDLRSAFALSLMVFASGVNILARDHIYGKDSSERFSDQGRADFAYEIMDRSGLMFYMSPYVDSAFKLTGANELLGMSGSSRFERNEWWQSLLGVNFGLMGDLASVASTASQYAAGDANGQQMVQKLINVSPAAMWMRMAYNNIYD